MTYREEPTMTETTNYGADTADVITNYGDHWSWLVIGRDRDGVAHFATGQRFSRTVTTDDVPDSALVQGF